MVSLRAALVNAFFGIVIAATAFGAGVWLINDRNAHHTPAPAPAPPAPSPSGPGLPTDLARALITTINDEPLPSVWPLGYSVGLSAAGSVCGTSPNSVRWDVEPTSYDKFSYRINNNRQILIPTGTTPVTLTVRLTVARGDTTDVKSWMIVCKGDGPNPPTPTPFPVPPMPNPTPTPTPTPVPPPAPVPLPLSADAKAVSDMAKANINVIAQKTVLNQLAGNYDTVHTQISQAQAGLAEFAALKTPEGIVAKLVELNRATVGAARADWLPFFTALQVWSDAKSAAGTLATPADYSSWTQAIADGLRNAALVPSAL